VRPWLWPALVALAAGLASCSWEAVSAHNAAIVVGVTDYPGTAKDLHWPAIDAGSVAALLDRGQGGLFDSVTTLTDAAATKAAVQAAIAAAGATLNSQSEVVFYFSGHGGQLDLGGGLGSHAVIVPSDGLDASGTVVSSDLITEDELRTWLTALPTHKVVVILDSCNSGGFLAGGASTKNLPQDAQAYYEALWAAFLKGQAPAAGADLSAWFDDITSDHTAELASWKAALGAGSGFASGQAQVLAAAGALEESYDANQYGHGAFTYYLLRAAHSGDYDHNGYVTVGEAYRFAFHGLQDHWNQVWGVVGAGGFSSNPSELFLPQLSSGPVDFLLFKN